MARLAGVRDSLLIHIVDAGQKVLTLPGYGIGVSPLTHFPPPWWLVAGKTCEAAYQAKGAASLAASYVNLANPGTDDATVVVAPTWDDVSGWKSTNVNNGPKLSFGTINDGYTVLVRWSNYVSNNGTFFGVGIDWRMRQRLGDLDITYTWGNVASSRAPFVAAAVAGMADNQPYRNGSVDGGAIAGAWAGGAQTLTLFRTGADTYSVAVYIQAFVIYSDTLTAGEVAIVSAAMAAL